MNPWESNYKSHQGNVGLGRAIAYYTEKGYTVMLPLNDTQKYDLVIDKDGLLQRVSVKTTQFIANKKNEFSVLLKNVEVLLVMQNVNHLIIKIVIYYLY